MLLEVKLYVGYSEYSVKALLRIYSLPVCLHMGIINAKASLKTCGENLKVLYIVNNLIIQHNHSTVLVTLKLGAFLKTCAGCEIKQMQKSQINVYIS